MGLVVLCKTKSGMLSCNNLAKSWRRHSPTSSLRMTSSQLSADIELSNARAKEVKLVPEGLYWTVSPSVALNSPTAPH